MADGAVPVTLRVAFDLRPAQGPHRYRGIGRYTRCLAEALARLGGCDLVTLGWAGLEPEPQVALPLPRRRILLRWAGTDPGAGVTFDPPALWQAGAWWRQFGLPRLLRRLGVDLVHHPDWDLPVWQPVPSVVTIHDAAALGPNGGPPDLTTARSAYRWRRLAARRAAAVLTNWGTIRDDLIALVPLDARKVEAIPLGLETQFQPPPPSTVEAVKRRYGLPEDYLFYVGGLDRQKAPDLLVEMSEEAARLAPALTLVIASGDPGDPAGTARVRHLGYVPDEDLPALYAGAAACVSTARWIVPLTLLEAQACGTPGVAFRTPSAEEALRSGAILVEPGDAAGLAAACVALFRDGARRRALAEEGLANARRFTWDRTARGVLNVYRRVAGTGGA